MKPKLFVFLFLAAIMSASLNDLFADVINVPDDFETIQAAVNNTAEGDTVLVQPGVYNERVGMPPNNIVLTSLRIIEGDEDFIERTIIDGVNINRSTVRVADGTDERTVIDGFTIINGDTDYGGGIYIANAGPTLRFLILSDNDADRGGGGLYVTRMSWPSISNSVIRNNFGFIGGGVVVINGSSLTVNDCVIEGNTTNEHGAGIHCTLDSELNLEDVIIRENEATMFGGGLHINARTVANLNRVRIVDNIGDTGGGFAVRAEAVLNATNVEVIGNFSNTNGGGLYADGSTTNMTDCSFFNNSSQSQGGGQYFWAGTAEFTRCIIADNECPTAGVIQNLWGEVSYYNCTIANNRGEESSEIGVIIGKLTLLNSIVWSEDRPILTTSPDELDSIAVSYCDITGGQDAFELEEDDIFEWGDGNINGDPQFVDEENLDYHLTEDSPCIDVGDPDSPEDPDGTRADMGAFSFEQENNDPEIEHFAGFIESDLQHTIAILEFQFNNEAAPIDWEIAIFTREYVLSGAVYWHQEEDVELIVYGDNPDTDEVEGFYEGEWMMNFKAWDPEEEREYRLGHDPQVDAVQCHWHDDGESTLTLWGNSDIVEQVIQFERGWNNFTIDIMPSAGYFRDQDDEFPSAVQIVQQFWDRSVDNIRFCWAVMVNDGEGHGYGPRQGFNNLWWIIPGQEYQINVERAITGTWWGTPLNEGEPELQHFVDVQETEVSHLILVDDVQFDDEPVPDGWEMAVFTRNDILAGASIWNEGGVELIAYGDNPDTDEIEGFYDGEWMMNFKAWDQEEEREYRVGYRAGVELELCHWHDGGETTLNLWSDSDIVEQVIEFEEGWNGFTINLLPALEFFTDPDDEFPGAVQMVNQLCDRSPEGRETWLLIMLRGADGFFDPEFNFDNLRWIIPGEEYQINMLQPMTATWWGMPLNDGEPELQHFVDYVETDLIYELTIREFLFDDAEAEPGWEIGVFTRDDVLAGAGIWTAEEEFIIMVYGDDPETDEVEGLYQGEWMGNMRAWNPETEQVHRAGWEEQFGGFHWNDIHAAELNLRVFPDIVEQRLELNEGWNMVSLNIRPSQEFYDQNNELEFPDVVSMTWQLWDMIHDGGDFHNEHFHHILIKDGLGRFYVPAWGFHNLPGWLPNEGYQILMDADITATWWGTQIAAQEEIVLGEGWGIYPYYPTYELTANAQEYYVLSSVIENIEIAKDELGHFLVPGFDFSNMPPWRAGKGYQIKTTQECVLVYPEQRDEELNASENMIIRHWDQPSPTGNNMSILVELKDVVAQNSEIAAFTESGQLVGCGVVNENWQCGIAVWGDDEATVEVEGTLADEALKLKLWDGGAQGETDLQVSELIKGKGLIYTSDGFTALTCTEVLPLPTEMKIISIAPNPFNPTTTITYGLPQASRVTLKMYDISGRLVSQLINGRQEAGVHAATVKADDWASGLYFVRLEAGGEVFTRQVMLVR